MLKPSFRRRFAFTIAELIIVMMIIVLLVAILLPALSSARARAKKVATTARLNAIGSACESYSIAMGSMPGYLADSFTNSLSTRAAITGNENMVISLMGQVKASAANSYNPNNAITAGVVDLDAVGSGPRSAGGKTYGAFYSPKPSELQAIGSGTYNPQNQMPELLDPDTGMPILYYRVNPRGTVPVTTTYGTGTGGQISLYSYIDYFQTTMQNAAGESKDLRTLSLLGNTGAGSSAAAAKNLAMVVADEKLSTLGTGTQSANDANDVISGGYVLISGGDDGIPFAVSQNGNSTNIANKDALDGFDDIVLIGGSAQ